MKDFSVSLVNTNGVVFPGTLSVNASGPSATDGTEWVKVYIDDYMGSRQDLMVEAGLTPDGNDEAVGSSQFVEALKRLIGGGKIQPIGASIAANAMTITLSPTFLDFRDATLGSGTVNTRISLSSLSLVISSGSTLGTISTIQSRIAVLAIDNAGTMELAAVNISGGNNLDETTLITTVAEGGVGAADTANVIYSASARANVPFRVVGYIESTQTVAGAWSVAPSTIQGYGGQAFAAMSSLGYGQAWQDVSGSRVSGTTYYNTTGKPISVSLNETSAAGVATSCTVRVDGLDVSNTFIQAVVGLPLTSNATAIVPPGSSYIGSTFSGTVIWYELR